MASQPISPRPDARSALAYSPLVVLIAALATGILLDRYWPQPAGAWWLAGTVALTAWVPLWLLRWTAVSSMALAIGWLCTAGAWHHDYWNLYPEDEIGRMVREEIRPICVEAVAVTSPRWVPAPTPTAMRIIPKGEESEVYLWLTAVRDGSQWRPASGWALMEVDGNLVGVRAGDRLRVMALGSRPLGPVPGKRDAIVPRVGLVAAAMARLDS